MLATNKFEMAYNWQCYINFQGIVYDCTIVLNNIDQERAIIVVIVSTLKIFFSLIFFLQFSL